MFLFTDPRHTNGEIEAANMQRIMASKHTPGGRAGAANFGASTNAPLSEVSNRAESSRLGKLKGADKHESLPRTSTNHPLVVDLVSPTVVNNSTSGAGGYGFMGASGRDMPRVMSASGLAAAKRAEGGTITTKVGRGCRRAEMEDTHEAAVHAGITGPSG